MAKITGRRTTNKRREICPFSFMVLAPYESEKVIFVLGDKKIIARRGAFLNFCASYGLPIPDQIRSQSVPQIEVDAETWINEITQKALSQPLPQAEALINALHELTARLKTEVDIAKAVASMSAHA